MYQNITDYVSTCDTCQKAKVERNRHPVPLNPLPVEDVFARVHIDILCSLPKTKQSFQYVLLVVDSFFLNGQKFSTSDTGSQRDCRYLV